MTVVINHAEPVTVVEVAQRSAVINNHESIEVVDVNETVAVVMSPATQGPPGISGAQVSSAPNNRLEGRPDGLYVSDELTPDPLAYYILAKS